MKAFQTVRFCTCVILGLLLVSAAYLFTPTAVLAKRPTPVTVVNPSTSPVPVAVTEYHFVGSSASAIAPHDGPLAMNQACSSYGTGARMCTVDEFFSSATLTQVGTVTTYLWANPSIHDCVYNSTASATQCFEQGVGVIASSATDATVTNDGYQISCGGWSGDCPSGVTCKGTIIGYYGSGAGPFTVNDYCSASHNVACCAR